MPSAVDSRFGYRHTGGSRPDPALIPSSQGLIHQILSAHASAPGSAPAVSSSGSSASGTRGGSGGPAGPSVSVSPVGLAGPASPSGPAGNAGTSGTAGTASRPRLQKSVSLNPTGERRQPPVHPRLTRSVTLREGSSSGSGGGGSGGGGGGGGSGGGGGGGGGGGVVSPRPPAKESGNARVGRYIRSLLQRISEVPDQ